MAIAFDAFGGTGGGSGGVTNITWSHITGTGNTLLLVGALGNTTGAGDNLSTCTYNGVNMPKVFADLSSGTGRFMNMYALIAPASGSNTVQLNSSPAGFLAGFSVSYTGVLQTGFPDNSAETTATSVSTFSNSITPVNNSSWAVSFVTESVNTISAGSGTTLRTSAGNSIGFFDSNAATGGAYTLNYTGGAGSSWGGQIITIAPLAGPATTTPLLSLLGVGT